eukprot:gene7608-11931_t
MKTFFAALLCIVFVVSAQNLESYNVDKSSITLSGLSAGGYFSVQFQIAYSSLVKGVGVIAGGPYYCSQFQILRALNECMVRPAGINIETLVKFAKKSASNGEIDPLSNVPNQKILVIHGNRDTTINIGVSKKLVEFYRALGHRNVKTKFDIPADHAMITNKYGNSCSHNGSPYINNCNFDLAGEILKTFYGSLKDPKASIVENLLK